MSKESFDLSGSHFNQMAFVVLENKALCPMNIGFLAGVGIVFDANGVLELVKQISRFLG